MARLASSAIEVSDSLTILQRLDLIEAVKAYNTRYSKQAEPILRAVLVARLWHERRLGELLAATVRLGGDRKSADAKIAVVSDDTDLPEGVSRDLSSNAQTLAAAPREWFEGVGRG